MRIYIDTVVRALLPALFAAAFLAVPAPAQAGPLYLAGDQDPGFLETLASFSTVEYERGRTLLVRLTVPYEALPEDLRAKLRPVSPGEVYNAPATLSQKETVLPEAQALVARVSADRIKSFTQSIVMTGRRSVSQLDSVPGSGNKRAMDIAAAALQEYGFAVERHCYKARKIDKECNIVGVKPGPRPDSKAILVLAHLDSVGHENAGADDNASGTAGLLEMARALSGYRSDHALIFAATNGEESGIVGGYALAKKLQGAGELGRIAWAVNLDMIAWNRDGVVELETNKEFIAHADWVGAIARLYTRLQPHVASPAWGSDHVPFLEAGIPAYLSIEHWEDHTPCYHKSCDTMDGLNWGFAADIVKLNLAVIAHKTRLEPVRQ